MPGLYTLVATRVDGETLTAAKYNADEQNHIDNQELQKTDDFSSSVGQMQTTADPGEAGSESLATDASGELARLRFAIKEAKDALGTTVPQWYSTPGTVSGLVATQNTRNLCLNSDVEDWRNGTTVAPFGFVLSGAGATVARDGTNFKTGLFSAAVTRAGADAILQRDCIAAAGGQAHIRSRAYRFSAWVRATVASRVRIRINDGVGSTFSAYHTGGGAFERLSVTRTLDAAATALNIGLSVDTGDTTGQIDALMPTEGTAEVAFAPRLVADTDTVPYLALEATGSVFKKDLVVHTTNATFPLTYADSVDTSVVCGFPIPTGYASGDLTVKLFVRPAASGGTIRFRRTVTRVRDATALSTIDSLVVVDYSPADTNSKMLSFTIAAANFAAGDIIHVQWERNGTSGADSNTGAVAFENGWFEYTGRP